MSLLRPLLRGGHFFESPRWHEGRWWVSDMYGGSVLAVPPDGAAERVAEVEGQPSGLGWLADGTLLVVSMTNRAILAGVGGTLRLFADLSGVFSAPANDLLVAATGDVWVGSLGFDMAAGAYPQPSPLVHVDATGFPTTVAEGLMVPNGCVLLPDGRTLVVAETLASRLTAFTVSSGGALTNRRVWAELASAPPLGDFRTMFGSLACSPDGIAADAEGCVWVADPVGRTCLRVREGGEVVATLDPPDGQSVFACGLGGPGGADLLLCCAPDASRRRRLRAADAELLVCRVDVPAST